MSNELYFVYSVCVAVSHKISLAKIMKKVSTIDEIVKSTEVVYHVSIVESHVKFSKMLFLENGFIFSSKKNDFCCKIQMPVYFFTLYI